MSPSYLITGGEPVSGRIRVLGAKNFATKAMVATGLAAEPCTLTNVPDIGDTALTLQMLQAVGIKAESPFPGALQLDATSLNSSTVPIPDSGSNRIPILLLSVLLHRTGEAHVPFVAGCKIGPRPVDFHLKAAELFGARITIDDSGYHAEAPNRLKACHYTLPYPSVGATESCLLLGSLAEGTSVISNVATEPEITALITMLNAMGARIAVQPNRQLVIEGVDALSGTRFPVLGDRIEAASWACLAAATDGSITVGGVDPATLSNFFAFFTKVGGGVRIEDDTTISFFRRRPLSATVLETDVYPGFATDWQQPFAVLLTQARGVSVLHETVYERRFGYLRDLERLGARVQVETACLGSCVCRFRGHDYPHSALILGPTPLTSNGAEIEVPDLRAGLAYLIAAAMAEGTTRLTHAERIDRGYGRLTNRCSGLNLRIRRDT